MKYLQISSHGGRIIVDTGCSTTDKDKVKAFLENLLFKFL